MSTISTTFQKLTEIERVAFRRGAEAMREAAAKEADEWTRVTGGSSYVADRIRALPLPEEPT